MIPRRDVVVTPLRRPGIRGRDVVQPAEPPTPVRAEIGRARRNGLKVIVRPYPGYVRITGRGDAGDAPRSCTSTSSCPSAAQTTGVSRYRAPPEPARTTRWRRARWPG